MDDLQPRWDHRMQRTIWVCLDENGNPDGQAFESKQAAARYAVGARKKEAAERGTTVQFRYKANGDSAEEAKLQRFPALRANPQTNYIWQVAYTAHA